MWYCATGQTANFKAFIRHRPEMARIPARTMHLARRSGARSWRGDFGSRANAVGCPAGLRARIGKNANLIDLRGRLAATRWPEQEVVADQSQGVRLATIMQFARYWQSDYDWRKVEARLNALPQFITEIDGLDIHFVHVRLRHENALPLIVIHGWPGSVIEQLKIIDPLTNPTGRGASLGTACGWNLESFSP
jgi:Epoxide hydrolase N terminus